MDPLPIAGRFRPRLQCRLRPVHCRTPQIDQSQGNRMRFPFELRFGLKLQVIDGDVSRATGRRTWTYSELQQRVSPRLVPTDGVYIQSRRVATEKRGCVVGDAPGYRDRPSEGVWGNKERRVGHDDDERGELTTRNPKKLKKLETERLEKHNSRKRRENEANPREQ